MTWSLYQWGLAGLSSVGADYAEDVVMRHIRVLDDIEAGRVPGLAPDALRLKMRELDANVSAHVSRAEFLDPWELAYAGWQKTWRAGPSAEKVEEMRVAYGHWLAAYEAEIPDPQKLASGEPAPMFSTRTTVLLTLAGVGLAAIGYGVWKRKVIAGAMRDMWWAHAKHAAHDLPPPAALIPAAPIAHALAGGAVSAALARVAP